jgi:type II secretory pathway pseudopilin PulG
VFTFPVSRFTSYDSGFTLVAVMIGIAILTILIAGVAPSVGTVMKRDREQELIFRGKQYARAIALFQRRYGRYPNELKELYANRPRTIRKLWKDPFCNCDFYALIQGMPDALPGGPTGLASTTPTPSLFSAPPTRNPTAGPFGPGSGETKTIGPIVGVRSTVHKEALAEWRGQKYYDQWRFIVGDADRNDLLTPGQGLPPGAPLFPTQPPAPAVSPGT